jgi:hypothetical protein
VKAPIITTGTRSRAVKRGLAALEALAESATTRSDRVRIGLIRAAVVAYDQQHKEAVWAMDQAVSVLRWSQPSIEAQSSMTARASAVLRRYLGSIHLEKP